MLNHAVSLLYPVAIAALSLSSSSLSVSPLSEPQSPQQAAFSPRTTASTQVLSTPIKQNLSTPTVKKQYRYYSIAGNTAAELRSQMNQLGPFDSGEGRRYDARTDWYVRWFYRYINQNQQCQINNVNTHVDVIITLPRWEASTGASRSLRVEWERYITALQLHEDGHGINGIHAGQHIYQALWSLPAYPSCEALKAAVEATVQKTVRIYNQKDLAYDQQTQHGLIQGAAFPSSRFATVQQ